MGRIEGSTMTVRISIMLSCLATVCILATASEEDGWTEKVLPPSEAHSPAVAPKASLLERLETEAHSPTVVPKASRLESLEARVESLEASVKATTFLFTGSTLG